MYVSFIRNHSSESMLEYFLAKNENICYLVHSQFMQVTLKKKSWFTAVHYKLGHLKKRKKANFVRISIRRSRLTNNRVIESLTNRLHVPAVAAEQRILCFCRLPGCVLSTSGSDLLQSLSVLVDMHHRCS